MINTESTKKLIEHLDEYMKEVQNEVKTITYPVPDAEKLQSIIILVVIAQHTEYLNLLLKDTLPYKPVEWNLEEEY